MDIQQDTAAAPVPTQRRKAANIILIGGTAAGKSTVGYQLAKIMNLGIADIDAMVEVSARQTIRDIFQSKGEQGFRDLETEILSGLEGIQNHVIVAGGGLAADEQNWQQLQSLGRVVWLATPTDEVLHRILDRPEELRKRPLIEAAAEIEDREKRTQFIRDKLDAMMELREPTFAQADVTINCSYATAETCAQFIKLRLSAKSKSESADHSNTIS